MHASRVAWDAFCQHVRRFRPSDVLSASARLSALNGREHPASGPTGTDDFALALICKTAICHGTEFRKPGVTYQDMRALCREAINLPDPFLANKDIGSFLVRIGHEQFPYQVAPSQPLGRTRALLVDAAAAADQQVISPSFWMSALGCSLEHFVGVALLLYAASKARDGVLYNAWFGHPSFAPLYKYIPRDVIEMVARRWFTQTLDQFRSAAQNNAINDPSLKRYEFNPLVRAPFVEIQSGVSIAPVLPRVLLRATPGSLYYVGVEHGGNDFANALGSVFEVYVGMQLQLADPARLIREREYKRGAKSVDYIAVFDSLLLLIEVKATPLTISSRLGLGSLSKDILRAPGKAEIQIERTAKLIRQKHAAFRDVPSDRPMLGLIVTLEPYCACDNNWVIPDGGRTLAIGLCSSHELEDLMTMPQSLLRRKLSEAATRNADRTWSVRDVIANTPVGKNPILERAWKAYPFPTDGVRA